MAPGRSWTFERIGEAVLRRRLVCFGFGPRSDNVRDRAGRLGGLEPELLQLPPGRVVECDPRAEVDAKGLDHPGRPDVFVERLLLGDLVGGVSLGDVGRGDPRGLGGGGRQGQPFADEAGQKGVGRAGGGLAPGQGVERQGSEGRGGEPPAEERATVGAGGGAWLGHGGFSGWRAGRRCFRAGRRSGHHNQEGVGRTSPGAGVVSFAADLDACGAGPAPATMDRT